MAQIFRTSTNSFLVLGIVLTILLVAAAAWAGFAIARSPYITNVGLRIEQPVPFSHKHHVAGVGLDCRYCHVSVEVSATAGMPSTEVCMTCHSQIWARAPMLQPVRDSYASGEPIRWNRVHRLPDFVFFNHSIHVQKGVGCTSCHGNVRSMALMQKAEPLTMQWCLNCHSHPEAHLRPRKEVFNMDYQAPDDQEALGRKLVKEYKIEKPRLIDCYTCHR